MLESSALVNISVYFGLIILNHQLVSGRRVNPVRSQRRGDAEHDFAQGRDRKSGSKTPLVPDSRPVSVRRLLQRVPIAKQTVNLRCRENERNTYSYLLLALFALQCDFLAFFCRHQLDVKIKDSGRVGYQIGIRHAMRGFA